VALANLRLIESLGLVEHVRDEIGPAFAAALAGLRGHPLVGHTESCGMMGAIHLMKDSAAQVALESGLGVGTVCRSHCFDQGLVMRAVGDRMVVAPPLVMTLAQLDEMMVLVRRCLDLTLEDVRRRGWLT
jgi:putrescine aminotransferase